MLVDVPVSSMKTSFGGSSHGWRSSTPTRRPDVSPFLLGGVHGFFKCISRDLV